MSLRAIPNNRADRQPERGLMSTELSMLMPILLVFALLGVYVIQVERHSSRAQQAADAAARAASFERTEADALAAAQQAAEAVCAGPVVIASDGFRFTPPETSSFTPGSVAVGLTCTEPFNGFAPLVQNSTRTESGVAVAFIEYWLDSP